MLRISAGYRTLPSRDLAWHLRVKNLSTNASIFSQIELPVTIAKSWGNDVGHLDKLRKKGFDVKSFGTGDKVKLPGNAPDRPNIYEFGTTYEEIYNDLMTKDKQ
ncbi:hypothetical protein QAD02_007955 [Eretmocerus hayati]|uniref:Uncharacterized protein n=1 Tax=Eretmocerus hayati TaxID=131215 RepID=A0ACC2N548_9HYME|nr:hypothetical protein QAD02_007955 [Eretmocerus hayati]